MSEDSLKGQWCCLDCASKFEAGKLRMIPGSQHLHCPECKSAQVHPADGQQVILKEYNGEIGTRN